MELLKYFKTPLKVPTVKKTEQEIIQEIHDAFDSAEDNLLNQAREIIGQIESQSKVMDKADRLKDLGFTASKVVVEGDRLKGDLVKSKEDAETVEYYKRTYPFLKFLRVNQLDEICRKYGLIYASVDKFLEDVPERNVREIENVQPLKSEDRIKNRFFLQVHKPWHEVPSDLRAIITKGFYVDSHFRANDKNVLTYARTHGGYTGNYSGYTTALGDKAASLKTENLQNLYIAAPKNHFDLEDTHQNGLGYFEVTEEVNINDPIVFRFVRGGIQVITKWGLEAEDPELQVGLMN